ncbi:MAG: TPM domain-containing protein [Blautia sp.]|nr:TPM domain-containing protein [Blautia sp.]MDY2896652.1 TPM domain-containing protein [Candidatus Limivivens sp.]
MRKKDRLFLTPLLLSGLLLTVAPGLKLPAMASESESETLMETEQFVFDKADLLTDAEEEELNEKANDLAGTFHMNFVILTTDDAEGKEAQAYADDFYMDNGFYDDGKDGGAIYLIDMDNRRVQVETAGDMKDLYITDARVEEIVDAGYENVKDGAYAEAFEGMLNATADFIEEGVASGKFNYNEDTGEYTYFDTEEEESRRITPVEFLIALGIALAAGGVAVSTVIGTYHLKWGTYEYPYKDKAGLKVRRSRDDFIGSHVTHRRIERESSSSDSGMTTTHDSSGGGNFGGGGRDF